MSTVTGDTAVLDALRAATGGEARLAGPGDEIDGVAPTFVVAPAGTAEAAEVMRIAAARELAVVPSGTGTKLAWGAPPARADLLVRTHRMNRVIEHGAGDLVVHAEAGVTLPALGEHLAPARQRLALDPVLPPGTTSAGTVGGVIATAVSGPLRLSHGAPRDLLIGITMVRADGMVAKAGGKVVKNVAGYDLGKLLTGSWGTLGLITEAVFRLHPLPALARWVVAPARTPAETYDLVRRLIHAQVVPTALEIDQPADSAGTLAVALEGIPEGVDGRVARVLELLGEGARVSENAPDWWGRAPWEGGDVALRLTHEIAGLPRLLDAFAETARRHGLRVAVRGSAGVGVLHGVLSGVPDADPAGVAAVVTELREQAAAWSGDVVVLDAPPPVKAAVDVWGPVRGLHLMRRVKDQFDPGHRLAPGRFVGGI
ncbi:FAD-binding oxidoreductase [Amycolatopsis pigmentata]|uniref:FAD-binding oxidoreductase n=1 Tax=Amycolatopsis pigmentata TaxID=450801 RepID=A0ABW5G7N8_9PSEU